MYLCISTNSINDSAFKNANIECVKIQIYKNIYVSSSKISNEHNIVSPAFSILSECDWLSMLQKIQCNEYNFSLFTNSSRKILRIFHKVVSDVKKQQS